MQNTEQLCECLTVFVKKRILWSADFFIQLTAITPVSTLGVVQSCTIIPIRRMELPISVPKYFDQLAQLELQLIALSFRN